MARKEYYQDGQLVRVEDTRTLAEAIEERKQVWADETTKLIRTKVTETEETKLRQRNLRWGQEGSDSGLD